MNEAGSINAPEEERTKWQAVERGRMITLRMIINTDKAKCRFRLRRTARIRDCC